MDELEKEELLNYKIWLYMLCYVYTDEIKETLRLMKNYSSEECVLYNKTFLEYFKNFIYDNKKYEYLNSTAKDNIFEIINYLKENDKELDDDKNEEYNELIRNVNLVRNDEGYYDFAKEEIRSRVFNKKRFDKFAYEIDLNVFKCMYGYDIITIESLMSDDDTFNNTMLNTFVFDEKYFLTIEKLCNEASYIFKDDDIFVHAYTVFLKNRRTILQNPITLIENPYFVVNNEIMRHKVKKLKKELEYNRN